MIKAFCVSVLCSLGQGLEVLFLESAGTEHLLVWGFQPRPARRWFTSFLAPRSDVPGALCGRLP